MHAAGVKLMTLVGLYGRYQQHRDVESVYELLGRGTQESLELRRRDEQRRVPFMGRRADLTDRFEREPRAHLDGVGELGSDILDETPQAFFRVASELGGGEWVSQAREKLIAAGLLRELEDADLRPERALQRERDTHGVVRRDRQVDGYEDTSEDIARAGNHRVRRYAWTFYDVLHGILARQKCKLCTEATS